jgi:hypothetical protein
MDDAALGARLDLDLLGRGERRQVRFREAHNGTLDQVGPAPESRLGCSTDATRACDTLAPVANRYDASTALIVVDVQNDFADPAGSLFVDGATDVVKMVSERDPPGDRERQLWSTRRTGTRLDPALRQGRRDLAGSLHRRHVGRGVPPRPERRGPVRPQGSNGEDGYPGAR